MEQIRPHIYLPGLIFVLFMVIAMMPVQVFGCLIRGVLAFAIAVLSGIAALVTAIVGLKRRLQSEADANLWVLSSLILTFPVIALLILA